MKNNICCKCGATTAKGIGYVPTKLSFPDTSRDTWSEMQLRDGPAELVECMKCSSCGHSYIPESGLVPQFTLVLTPTTDTTRIISDDMYGGFDFYSKSYNAKVEGDRPETNQYAHIIDNEVEPQVGDYVYDGLSRSVYQVQKVGSQVIIPVDGLQLLKKNCKKVLASTVSKLNVDAISDDFLRVYGYYPEMEIKKDVWKYSPESQHIKSVTISDFFGKIFTWDNLSEVNILTGDNGTGKTTVLDHIWSKTSYEPTAQIVGGSSNIVYLAAERVVRSGAHAIKHMLDAAKTCDILLIDQPERNLDFKNQRSIIDQIRSVNPYIQLFIITYSDAIFSQGYMRNRTVIGDLIS